MRTHSDRGVYSRQEYMPKIDGLVHVFMAAPDISDTLEV
jgi:hypothetical protein